MAYDAPTAATLAAVFPAFRDVTDATINYWLVEASKTVDARFPDDRRAHAMMLLTAHLMVTNGIGSGAEAELAAAGASGFKSFRSGALSLDRGDARTEGYASTSYGRQFLAMLLSVVGGPRLTGSGTVCGGYGADHRHSLLTGY